MRRDMDLIRYILKETASAQTSIDASSLNNSDYTNQQINYHAAIMGEAGLLDVERDTYYDGKTNVRILGLTWAGQDYLAAIESDTVWNKVKAKLKESGITASINVIKQLAEKLALGLLIS